MRWRIAERRSHPYMCCFCCHVRLGTVLIGIFSLLIDILVLTYALVLTIHPELNDQMHHGPDDMSSSPASIPPVTQSTLNISHSVTANNKTQSSIEENFWNCDDKLISLVLTVGSAALAVGLLYGTIRGYPKYVLPFLCLQVFDFCVTALSIIGYFSYEPSIKIWLVNQTWLPLKRELLMLDSGWLLLIAAVISVVVLWLQAYCISVVWSCYKFLHHMRQAPTVAGRTQGIAVELVRFDRVLTSSSSSVPHIETTATVMLPGNDLLILPPKYEDVLQMSDDQQRSTTNVISPPPYSTMSDE